MKNRHASSFKTSTRVRWVEDEKQQKMVTESATTSETLLEGELAHYRVKDSYSLHWGTSTELMDFQVISAAKKAMIFIVLLEGKLDFSYDDLRFEINACDEPVGVAVNLTKPATFRRVVKKDNRVTKLKIVLPIDWVTERMGRNVMSKRLSASI
ncbi:hypothetical protein [Vibrio sonorensis]|uniref:hypothetical protein n=1 Tax=Vibrio sonorensis TaxID=1004316 RepID=UPI001FE03388|nr:hypothetical protein [Vibrio sonorensis]